MRFIATLVALAVASPAAAQVTRLEITSREVTGGYERIKGFAHGEVDPADRRNRIIQDLDLAPRNARGRVEYVATFALTKPADPARLSGVLMYSVVNRGNGAPVESPEGHVSLVSGWQGDVIPTANNQTIKVPVARNRDGSDLTGPVLARFVDLPAGTTTASIRLGSMGSAAYQPVSLDTSRATLTYHASEAVNGAHTGTGTIPPADWAFADCRSKPFPGVPDPSRLCLKNGFDPARLYELVYTAKDPLVLGVGLAATRDLVSFFRYARADQAGTPNPVAGAIRHSVASGTSQAGQLPEDVRPSRLQRGSRRADRVGRHLPVHRRAADAAQLPFRRAGRRGRALRTRQRAGAVVEQVRRLEAGPWIGEPARSLRGFEDMSESLRGIRRDGVLGPADVAGARRHRRRTRHPASRQRQALLHAGHHPRRRPGRIRRRAGRQRSMRAAAESQSDGRYDACADGSARRLGRARNARRRRAAIRRWPRARWCPPRAQRLDSRPFQA